MMTRGVAPTLVSDFDGTLVPMGSLDPARLERFGRLWAASEPLPQLIVSSGRMVADLIVAVSQAGLPQPAYYIGGVGTQIHDADGQPLEAWTQLLGEQFDADQIGDLVGSLPAIQPQPAEFQSAHKRSWFWPDQPAAAVDALAMSLAAAGQAVTVVYSSNRDLDILPQYAGKGQALRWLAEHLAMPLSSVIVAGDSGNDASMFTVDGVRGIVVGNGHHDLRQVARASDNEIHVSLAEDIDGVIDGLQHFAVLATDSEAGGAG